MLFKKHIDKQHIGYLRGEGNINTLAAIRKSWSGVASALGGRLHGAGGTRAVVAAPAAE